VNVTIGPDSALLALPPSARKLVAQQIRMIRLLEQRPVVLMSPYTVTVK
jgi:hypothetical protein